MVKCAGLVIYIIFICACVCVCVFLRVCVCSMYVACLFRDLLSPTPSGYNEIMYTSDYDETRPWVLSEYATTARLLLFKAHDIIPARREAEASDPLSLKSLLHN